MTDFLKTVFLVNALIIIAFAMFYEAVTFCSDRGLSAWLAVPLPIAFYVWFLWRGCRRAPIL